MPTASPLQKQLIKFTLIGVLAVFTDLCLYYVLLNFLPEQLLSAVSNEAVAKSISFMCGLFVTYSFNKRWTWKQNNSSQRRLAKFGLLYALSLTLNVGVNSLLIFVLYRYQQILDLPFKYFIAFTGATGVSAVLNFTGQKFWVFSDKTALVQQVVE